MRLGCGWPGQLGWAGALPGSAGLDSALGALRALIVLQYAKDRGVLACPPDWERLTA